MITTYREELAWAAGFLDGEGWFGTIWHKPHKAYQPTISATQTSVEPLARLTALFGGNVNGPYPGRKAGHKTYWSWNLYRFALIQAAIAALWDFLSPVKQQQAKLVLTTMKDYHGR